MPTKRRLAEFRTDPEAALRRFLAGVPDPPPIAESELVQPVLGKLDMPNTVRGPVAPGLALVGDAALATDPLWGVGCGWALQSAAWLADAVAPALRSEEPMEPALRRYRRTFRRRLLPHAAMIHDYATGRRLTPPERLIFAAATRDDRLAALTEAYGTRNIGPGRYLPAAMARAAVVTLRGRSRAATPRRAADDAARPAPAAARARRAA